MNKKVGVLATGQIVLDRPNSHVSGDIYPALLRTALAAIYVRGNPTHVQHTVTFGEIIGYNHCVTTGPDDIIIYAKRHRRKGYTRFVQRRKPTPCNTMAVVLVRDKHDPRVYVLITAYIGTITEPYPWDPEWTKESRSFWLDHALIWEPTTIQSGTVRYDCPW